MGAASNGGGLASSWMTNPTSRLLPNREQWSQLKVLMAFGDEMDGEVRRLQQVAAGEDRPVIGQRNNGRGTGRGDVPIITAGSPDLTGSASIAATRWEGWGTALKPAHEPIVVARKPLIGTVAANVQAYGTGGVNIDACRVATDGDQSRPARTLGASSAQRKGH